MRDYKAWLIVTKIHCVFFSENFNDSNILINCWVSEEKAKTFKDECVAYEKTWPERPYDASNILSYLDYATLCKEWAANHPSGKRDGYDKLATYLGGVSNYGKDRPINLLTVLDSNGVNDCLWCFRATIEDPKEISSKLIIALIVWTKSGITTQPIETIIREHLTKE